MPDSASSRPSVWDLVKRGDVLALVDRLVFGYLLWVFSFGFRNGPKTKKKVDQSPTGPASK